MGFIDVSTLVSKVRPLNSEAIPKTLHLLVRSTGGGTETNIQRLCRETPNFHVITMEDLGAYPLGPAGLWRTIRRLRQEPAESIFCYGVTGHLAAFLAFPSGKRALVGNIRCESDFEGWKGAIRQAIGWRFSLWLSNSRKALGDWPGMVIYNGVPEPGREAPAYPGLPGPVFGLVARGHPKKGHHFFLQLWDQLGRPGSLIFAGKLPSGLKKKAESMGAICPGFVEPGPILQSLDLLVAPSTAEGVPTVLLEAMMRGVPCLATPAGGIQELITHRESGFVLPRPQWKEFFERIDWDEARRAGEAGREVARREFSFERMQERFIEAARKAAGLDAEMNSSSSFSSSKTETVQSSSRPKGA